MDVPHRNLIEHPFAGLLMIVPGHEDTLPDTWGETGETPDLAGMYACAWSIDENEMRATLSSAYEDDLSRD